MKTVMDAVNYLRGDLDNCSHWSSGENVVYQTRDAAITNAGRFTVASHDYCRDYFVEVCTIEEFNQCVAELSAWQPSIPTETPDEKLCLDAIGQKSPYDVGAHVSDEVKSPVNEEMWKAMTDATNEAFSKPVFTKAMHDAGGLPPVGSYVEISESTEYLKIRYEAGSVVKVYAVFTDGRGVNLAAFVDDCGKVGGIATAECFKPIQTEREKFIDVVGDILDCHEYSHELGEAYDAGYRLTTPPKQG